MGTIQRVPDHVLEQLLVRRARGRRRRRDHESVVRAKRSAAARAIRAAALGGNPWPGIGWSLALAGVYLRQGNPDLAAQEANRALGLEAKSLPASGLTYHCSATSMTPGQGNFPEHPHYLAPPMPWPGWRHMPDADLWAIAAYLKRAVKPVNNKVADSEGPPDFWASEYTVGKSGPYPAPAFPTANEAGGR